MFQRPSSANLPSDIEGSPGCAPAFRPSPAARRVVGLQLRLVAGKAGGEPTEDETDDEDDENSGAESSDQQRPSQVVARVADVQRAAH